MSMSYPRQLRSTLCKRLLAGEIVALLSKESGVCEGTLYRWKLQAKIVTGTTTGAKCYESPTFFKAFCHCPVQVRAIMHLAAQVGGSGPRFKIMILGQHSINSFARISQQLQGSFHLIIGASFGDLHDSDTQLRYFSAQ